ncbi:IscS subfamily cysteine desulfurase [Sphingobacterium kyonggiense]|uniref:cysteine desulfurase n=1 Tax=Sphingobacterium kyonggiense TaxID=714075 RepID=A0ABP7YTW7_9SPHI
MGLMYFDNNATTRIDDQVLAVMMPYLQESYGNASSVQHKLGRQANHAIENARKQIANSLNCHTKELFFCSGSTEAINTVLRAFPKAYKTKGNHIISCKTEHKAILSTCAAIHKEGTDIQLLDVDSNGSINLKELENAIREDTILVSLMAANNETGVLHPIAEIAEICTRKDVLFFCDATQWIGKIPLDLQKIPIDILCFSAHKFHGPKGAAAIFIRRKSKPIQIPALIVGGNQESGFRGGTYAVPQIAGMGESLFLSNKKQYTSELRDYFEEELQKNIPDISIHAKAVNRLPNTSNIQFLHVRGAELMTKLPDMCISSGSACVSGSRDPSHVLKAMGLSDEDAFCSLRFSFSRHNTILEIDRAVELLKNVVTQIREQSPIWQMYKEGLL